MEARVRVDRVRDLLRLLAETGELERAGECPRVPQIAGLAKLVDADVAGFFSARGYGSAGGICLDESVDVGWPTSNDRERTFRYILEYGDPIASALAGDPPKSPRAVSRRAVIGDTAWYRTELASDVHRSMGLDDVIIGVLDFGSSGAIRAFYLKRRWGARPYSDEETALVQLFLDGTRAFDPSLRPLLASLGLAPREERTLELLLEGLSEKEAAAKLGVTANTLHGYAKDLYRKLDVSSRYELFSRFRAAKPARAPRTGAI